MTGVLINCKICDNSPDCTGIADCPKDALVWDDENKTIHYDREKCNLCGLCEKACEVGAIKVARTEKEYQKIKQDIEDDPRKVEDLFTDKYGADTIQEEFLGQQDKFAIQVLKSSKLTMVEFFRYETMECLANSIPIKEIFTNIGKEMMFRKVRVEDKSIMETYGISELPSLLFFKDGEMIGKVEGYYDNDSKEEFFEKIKEEIETE